MTSIYKYIYLYWSWRRLKAKIRTHALIIICFRANEDSFCWRRCGFLSLLRHIVIILLFLSPKNSAPGAMHRIISQAEKGKSRGKNGEKKTSEGQIAWLTKELTLTSVGKWLKAKQCMDCSAVGRRTLLDIFFTDQISFVLRMLLTIDRW